MDWVQIGTLVAALVAAAAAVWGALISHRQLRHTVRSSGNPLPMIEAQLLGVEGQPTWTGIRVVARNLSNVPIDLLSVAVVRPRGVLLISDAEAFPDRNDWNEPKMAAPLPVDLARSSVRVGRTLQAEGSREPWGRADIAHLRFYAHRAISDFGDRPSLSLEMRWRDQTTKTFAIAVNVIKPSTM